MGKNTSRYFHFKGRDVLNVEGTMPLKGYNSTSMARYNSNGVFEIFAKFDSKVPFNESAAKRYLAPRLKALFSPSKYLLIVECAVHTRRHQRNLGRFTDIQYYAICDKPEPEKVQMLQHIVWDMIEHCKEPVENETF